ncbi:DUF6221 family protein [Actinomadura nitritigenes]|uniref:DUF6221 family protein n=1 Tax=Actinomadura nitritigenes TaxID=134602 RepID=UPI0036A6616F
MARDRTAMDETAPPELVVFLRARLRDDWNYARDALVGTRWRAERTVVVLDTGAEIEDVFLGPADHIARFDPERVFAEFDAKQAIVDAYEAGLEAGAATDYLQGIGKAVALLAAVYADHADYRESWRPS